MNPLENLIETVPWLLPLIIVLVIWDGIWKLVGLWKSARNNDMTWFIIIALISSVGIVPIIYILMFQPRQAQIR